MSIVIPSAREEFQGFEGYYRDEIGPFLSAREDSRQEAVLHAGLILIAAFFAVLAILFLFPSLGGGQIQIAFFVGFGGLALAGWRVNKTRADISSGLIERVCSKLGYRYQGKRSRPHYFHDFDRLKLMPNFNREHWEDEVQGERAGAGFTLCEAHLKYKSSGKNSSTRTVFHGQLLVIDYHKEFLGETVVKRDAGMFNRLMKPGKEFQRVGIASSKFEKIFEAWSTDQVEARELLDPLVLERFAELDRLFNGAKLRAAFSGGKLFVALEVGDKLNMGSMFKSLHAPDRVNALLKEFDLIFDLIDVIVKPASGRLSGAFSVEDIKSA